MTIMHIAIPDDLKDAFEKAYPGETIEQAVERLLRAEVAKRQQMSHSDSASLVEQFRRIREQTPSTSDEEIRALREEGRP